MMMVTKVLRRSVNRRMRRRCGSVSEERAGREVSLSAGIAQRLDSAAAISTVPPPQGPWKRPVSSGRAFRRHDNPRRQIADPEYRGDKIVRQHHDIKWKAKIEVHTLVIEKIQSHVLEAIAIEQIA